MQWDATDQFGNLFVAVSDADSLESLEPHVASLMEELRERWGEGFRVTIDCAFAAMSGPDPDQVSHSLRVPWLEAQDETTVVPKLEAMISSICARQGWPEPEVVRQ